MAPDGAERRGDSRRSRAHPGREPDDARARATRPALSRWAVRDDQVVGDPARPARVGGRALPEENVELWR